MKMNDKTAQQNHMCKHIFKRQSASLSLHHIRIFRNKFKDSKNDWQNDIWKITHVNESLKVSKTEAMNIAFFCSKISSKTVKMTSKTAFQNPMCKCTFKRQLTTLYVTYNLKFQLMFKAWKMNGKTALKNCLRKQIF